MADSLRTYPPPRNVGSGRSSPMSTGRIGADRSGSKLLEDGGSVRASSLGKAAEEPLAGSGVNYDDVFGGPPRYATSMFASQAGGALPGLDEVFRTPARVPSFKASSLPVFELPVFGDDVFGGGAQGARPATLDYEDIFHEAGTVGAFAAVNMPGGALPRSKPSSRSSSRRLSPVHPAVSAGYPLQDDVSFTASSVGPLKPRPAAGKYIRRCSFSSFSTFDESGGKPPDSPFIALRSDPVASSVPSSPPRAGHWDHPKRPLRPTSGNSVHSLRNGLDVEVDDVFGGFPQRSSLISQPFLDTPGDASDDTNSSRTSGAGAFEKPFMRNVTAGNDHRLSSSTVDNHDMPGSNDPAFSSSRSSTDEQELHDDFIEIRMDRQLNSFVSETEQLASGKAWITVNDVPLSTRPSSKPPPARVPPAPACQLKFKSWKDWASEFPIHRSASLPLSEAMSSSFQPVVKGTTATVFIEKDGGGAGNNFSEIVEDCVGSMPISSPERQSYMQFSKLSVADNKVKAKSVKETIEMEERELQALLANAWKINEVREREKKPVSPAQEIQIELEEKEKDLHWKEWRKHLNRNLKAFQAKQEMQVRSVSREAEKFGKEWKKHPNEEENEEVIDKKSAEEACNVNDQVPVHMQGRFQGSVARRVVSGLEESLLMEENVKGASDGAPAKSSVTAISDVGAYGANTKEGIPMGAIAAQETIGLTVKEQILDIFNNLERVHRIRSAVNGGAKVSKSSDESLVRDGEKDNEILQNEATEDLEVFLEAIACSEDGFQEIEGESLERRKSRWERHVRARERAAKALEEKQQRDAEVQREQAEKQQQAEASDHQIKRWAIGKEGNLRALLSNLQHVLWQDSGWQPIPLTDLIEGAAVKKAYRKATLFVHPDKVQQKGATVQQKYVAERVFDILQEAWKTFNIQELF